jgi:excisionase family DNA binding protein
MTSRRHEDQTEEDLGAFAVAGFRQRFGIGNTKVYEEIKAGRLRAVKLGAKTLILYADAKAWVRSLPEMR